MNAKSTVKEAKMLATAASEAAGDSGRVLNVSVGYSISLSKATASQAKTFIRKFKESLNAYLEDMQGDFAINVVPDFSENETLQKLAKEQQDATDAIITAARQKYENIKQLETPSEQPKKQA